MMTVFPDMPREETTLLLMNRSPLQPPGLFFLKACERIVNRTHNNTWGSLKASMVALFADMPSKESALSWSHYRSTAFVYIG